MTIGSEFTLWAAIATLSTTAVLVTTYMIAAFSMSSFRKTHDRRFGQGLAIAIKKLNDHTSSREDLVVLQALPLHIKLRILHRLAGVVDGESVVIVVSLADQIGLTDSMRSKANSRFWWNRLQAVRYFSSVGGDQEIVLPLLSDSDSWVKTEAISWAGGRRVLSHIEELISILQSDDAFCRIAAQDSLVTIGKPAASAIATAIRGELTEPQLISFLTVARYLKDPVTGIAALSFIGHESHLVRAAAAKVVGATGVPGSSEVLVEMLGDESIEVKMAACEALGRLVHWPASSAISSLLDDESWDVQHSAAQALAQLGSPGIVSLQRAVNLEASGWELARRALDEAALPHLTRAA